MTVSRCRDVGEKGRLKISVDSGNILEKNYELLALGLYEDEAEVKGVVKELDDALNGLITDLIKRGEFRAKLAVNKRRPDHTNPLIYTQERIRTKRLLLLGLGRREEFDYEAVRIDSGLAALASRDLGLSNYAMILFGEESTLDIEKLAQSVVEGSELALYRYDRYKTTKEEESGEIEQLTIFVGDERNLGKAREGVRVGQVICEGVKLSRDLANSPSNEGTPSALADKAKDVAEKYGLKCEVLERSDMERLGMGGLLAVSSGSKQPPKLIVLQYNGADDQKPIILVGKAVTFDSGGVSIKPSEKMNEMKYDKSGGASVIAILQIVAELRLPLNIIGIIPATENLPSGSAYKPGDIIRFYDGKTAEIINTDAEGRLILSDALAYAGKYDPQAIIDIATLTGACIIALGAVTSGLMTNNDALRDRIVKSSEFTGERVWQLPLWKEYQEFIKSDVADIKNIGGRPAGAITAAAFLANSVGKSPWAHLDIAGTAWVQEGSLEKPYQPKGATGVGVRLLIELLRDWSSTSA